MSDFTSTLGEKFLEMWGTHDGQVKVASMGADTIKDRIREAGFLGSILKRTPVGRADCQVSTETDSLMKLVQTEPFSRGMTLSFRGKPEVNYISAPRYLVPFYEVGSLKYQKSKQELMAYDNNIVQIIKDNIPNDIEEVEDRQGVVMFELATQAGQKEANGVPYERAFHENEATSAYNIQQGLCAEKGKVKSIDAINQATNADGYNGVSDMSRYQLQKDDISKLLKVFPGDGEGKGSRLECDKMLVTTTDMHDVSGWSLSQVGDDIVKATTIDGYKFNVLQGIKFSKTLKTDILRPGNIYAFCKEEFLGGFFQLNKLEFEIEKKRNMFSFEAWEDIGMHIGMIFGVRKLELYAGSSDMLNTAHNANVLRRWAPVSEENLGRQNTLVSEGVFFPSITGF